MGARERGRAAVGLVRGPDVCWCSRGPSNTSFLVALICTATIGKARSGAASHVDEVAMMPIRQKEVADTPQERAKERHRSAPVRAHRVLCTRSRRHRSALCACKPGMHRRTSCRRRWLQLSAWSLKQRRQQPPSQPVGSARQKRRDPARRHAPRVVPPVAVVWHVVAFPGGDEPAETRDLEISARVPRRPDDLGVGDIRPLLLLLGIRAAGIAAVRHGRL